MQVAWKYLKIAIKTQLEIAWDWFDSFSTGTFLQHRPHFTPSTWSSTCLALDPIVKDLWEVLCRDGLHDPLPMLVDILHTAEDGAGKLTFDLEGVMCSQMWRIGWMADKLGVLLGLGTNKVPLLRRFFCTPFFTLFYGWQKEKVLMHDCQIRVVRY